ncbi:hypothetical protein [Rhodoligotrophos defluvii]|uniref:hypothetical protein n=1 Tax=Rhodoligotrophos defluvii TaxID=2561934 RepID=UPI0010C9E197|nr:hypothetical protein [Rhodoligotrophos defluvii]
MKASGERGIVPEQNASSDMGMLGPIMMFGVLPGIFTVAGSVAAAVIEAKSAMATTTAKNEADKHALEEAAVAKQVETATKLYLDHSPQSDQDLIRLAHAHLIDPKYLDGLGYTTDRSGGHSTPSGQADDANHAHQASDQPSHIDASWFSVA